MNRKHKILISCLAILFGVACLILSNPLRRHADSIRTKLLGAVPLGAERARVEQYLDQQHLRIIDLSNDRSTITTILGEYSTLPPLPAITTVAVDWTFNENQKLVAVVVFKETDGP